MQQNSTSYYLADIQPFITPPFLRGLTVVVVAISVTIAVVVITMLTIPSITTLCSIEDDAHIVVLLLVIEFLQFVDHRTFKQAATHYKDDSVGILFEELCVRNNLYRWTVNEDIVILFAQCLEHRREVFAIEEFGRVRRHGANREDIQAGEVVVCDNEVMNVRYLATELHVRITSCPVNLSGYLNKFIGQQYESILDFVHMSVVCVSVLRVVYADQIG